MLTAAADTAACVAGCGGGDDSTSPTDATETLLSASELRDAAESVCQQTDVALAGLRKEIREAKSRAELDDLFQETSDVWTAESEGLNELQPPAALADDWEDLTAAAEAKSDLEQKAAVAAESGDGTGVDYYLGKAKIQDKRKALAATRLGLEGCGTSAA